MSKSYDPAQIEPKWQRYWEEHQTFKTSEDPAKPKKYILDMFPYPSGAGLHVGHPEGYTATDIVSRYLRSKGYAVLHPMGWDAFGLPAEQYAIQTGTHPAVTTARNIENFKRQIKALGLSYDWDREIDTTDPNYVRWTQWIFLQLFKKGLAYQDEVTVNWCPALGTVLANEEVQDGRSERGNHPVKRVPLRQWMLKITAYADELLEDLAQVDWPEGTKRMQQEWIGRSEGAEIQFAIDGRDEKLSVFTTRPDTIYGVTYMALAPEHPLALSITQAARREAVEKYVAASRNKSDLDRKAAKEKTGVDTGAVALHPLTGKQIPIWIADYVLWGYGTGAIMAVPAHDGRDFEFASIHGIPIVQVIKTGSAAGDTPLRACVEEEGVSINSEQLDGLSTAEAKQKALELLEHHRVGQRRVEYKLRDWVFSRQRYWGEPIPVYFPVQTEGNPKAGAAYTIDYAHPIPLEESELPLQLPELEDFRPGDDPAGPLARAVDWRFFQKNGSWFARETNTMPQWAGSCWYYLRFMDPQNQTIAWSEQAADRWLPVDLYIGGAEHAVLHLLYARFWHKALHEAGFVGCKEPFKKLVHQGLILGEVEFTLFRDENGNAVSKQHVDSSLQADKRSGNPMVCETVSEEQVEKRGGDFVLKEDPSIVLDGRAYKMSKSRGNVVNPDLVIDRYGADAMRLYEMFLGPLEATKPWSMNGIQGVRRFLDRVHLLAQQPLSDQAMTRNIERHLHQTIRKVSEDIEELRFNTAISAMMVYSNELQKHSPVAAAALEPLILLLAPFAPHLAEELWEQLGHQPSIQEVPWPQFDPKLCEEDELRIPVQINGKVRGTIVLSKGANQQDAMVAANQDEQISKHLQGKGIKNIRWVPDRILTIVAQ